jgi:hypothetical protein
MIALLHNVGEYCGYSFVLVLYWRTENIFVIRHYYFFSEIIALVRRFSLLGGEGWVRKEV